MVAALRAIGLRPRLKTISDSGKFFTRINDSRTRAQAAFDGWFADFPSAAAFLPPLFSCGAFVPANPQNTNVSEFCDPAVDHLFSHAELVQSTNPAAATALWQRAERAILAQAPAVPLYNQENVAYVAKRVGNFEYHPQWGVLLDQLWVK
jgi:peptide/nickel transport system substrate-binding protein